MNEFDDEVIRGLLAAFYLCGGRASSQIQTPPDSVDAYLNSILNGPNVIGAAEAAGYIEVVIEKYDYARWYIVTEAGRRFFEGGSND